VRLTFSYDLSETDVVQGTLALLRSYRPALMWMATVLVGLLLIQLVAVGAKGFPSAMVRSFIFNAATLIGGGVAFAVFYRFYVVPKGCRRRMEQNPFLYRGITMDADEHGISFRNAKTASNWQWGDLWGFREAEDVFLICPSKTFNLVVPKRALSGTDGETFRQLIESRLERRSR